MAEKQEPRRPRYTIQCREHNPIVKWTAEVLEKCKCGNGHLFVDDHRKPESGYKEIE